MCSRLCKMIKDLSVQHDVMYKVYHLHLASPRIMEHWREKPERHKFLKDASKARKKIERPLDVFETSFRSLFCLERSDVSTWRPTLHLRKRAHCPPGSSMVVNVTLSVSENIGEGNSTGKFNRIHMCAKCLGSAFCRAKMSHRRIVPTESGTKYETARPLRHSVRPIRFQGDYGIAELQRVMR